MPPTWLTSASQMDTHLVACSSHTLNLHPGVPSSSPPRMNSRCWSGLKLKSLERMAWKNTVTPSPGLRGLQGSRQEARYTDCLSSHVHAKHACTHVHNTCTHMHRQAHINMHLCKHTHMCTNMHTCAHPCTHVTVFLLLHEHTPSKTQVHRHLRPTARRWVLSPPLQGVGGGCRTGDNLPGKCWGVGGALLASARTARPPS